MKPNKRRMIAAIGMAFILSCLSMLIPRAASAAPVDFTYHQIHNWHSNMCISGIAQEYCDEYSWQQWREVPKSSGYVQLRTAFSDGWCLTVPNASQANNQPLTTMPCVENPAPAPEQLFRKVPAPIGGGYYQLVTGHSRKCVTIQSESMLPGARLVQYECSPYSPEIDPIGAGYWNTLSTSYTYNRVHNWHSNMCITAYMPSAKYGVQNHCTDNPYEQWREVPTTGGFIQLRSAGIWGTCLEVANAGLGNNQPLKMAPCTAGPAPAPEQLFRKVPAPIGGGFYQLVAGHSGKCVTIQSESMQPGAQLVQYECSPNSPVIDPIGAGYWNTI